MMQFELIFSSFEKSYNNALVNKNLIQIIPADDLVIIHIRTYMYM